MLKRVLVGMALLCGLALFAAPTDAISRDTTRDTITFRDAFAVSPPFAPATTQWDAPDGERCDVPVVNWVQLGQQFTPRQCAGDKRERARVTLRANLDKQQPMALIVEWQIKRNGKILFRCTGPKTLFYNDSNLRDQIYKLTVKPGTDIQAVNLYVTVYGWSNLEWRTTNRCVNIP